MLKVIELFGGIGACTEALKRIGIDFKVVDYVEIDKYAVASYNAINGTNFKCQDICSWNKDIEADLIMHGSPCQDFSIAGNQAGGDEGTGTRSSLMYETIRIVNKIKPKYVIWENVKNLLSKKHKHNFDKYIEILNEGGYNSYYQVLNAKDYGIPQNRERVFTISIRKDIDIGFKFPEKQELELKLKDMLEEKVDEKYYLSDKMINYVLAVDDNLNDTKFSKRVDDCKFNKTPSYAITVRGAGGNQRGSLSNFIYKDGSEEIKVKNLKQQLCDYLVQNNLVKENDVINHSYSSWRAKQEFHTENSKNNNISATLTTRPDTLGIAVRNATKGGYAIATNGDSVNLAYPNSKTRRGRVGHQVSNTLQCTDNMGVVIEPKVIGGIGEKKSNGGTQWYQQDRIYDNKVALSVSTTAIPYYPDSQLRIRKLTPKECWRLMGFKDEEFEKAEKVNSNAQLYKQAGNSIVVDVLEKIFRNLL